MDNTDQGLIKAARRLIIEHQTACVSFVQRHLRLGYAKAKEVLVALEGETASAMDAEGHRVVLKAAPRSEP